MICAKVVAVGMHLLSWHSNTEYNNINPGIHIRDNCGIQVGAFYNSEKKLSTYVSYVIENKRFFAVAGVATGYKYRKVAPLVMVGVKIGKWRLAYVPKVKYTDTHLLHLAFEF